MKLDDERQSEMRSQISLGDSFVLDERVSSFSSISSMSLVASAMGTDGKSAVASKETILSLGPSLSFLISSIVDPNFL